MGTADRLRMLSESLLAEILEQVQTKSEVDLEIKSGVSFDPRRCKTSTVGRSAGLSVPRSSVRFRQKLKTPTPRTQIYMDLKYIDPQARVLNYCSKS